MEVGSGSGKYQNLLKFNPKQITAVEPSKAINVAKTMRNQKIIFKKIKENINDIKKYDFFFLRCYSPMKCKKLVKIYNSKTNGKFICWVYGYEGNELYIFIFNNLRRLTILLPDFLLRFLCNIMNLILYFYIFM